MGGSLGWKLPKAATFFKVAAAGETGFTFFKVAAFCHLFQGKGGYLFQGEGGHLFQGIQRPGIGQWHFFKHQLPLDLS